MRLPSYVQKFARSRSGDKSPPPYSKEKGGGTHSPIKATSTPQWKWTKVQCQEWLAAFFVHYLDYSPDDAEIIAQRFKGFGPDIYLKRTEEWKQELELENADALYMWILGRRERIGAVPWNLRIGHGYKPE